MAELDDQTRKLTLKVVYYGPALSGKTTNLARLHDFIMPQSRGDLMVLDTKNDRTLFFDLLPLGMRAPSGLLVKLRLFTVPGQVAYDSTRKAVLSRADGVVFVADSQRTQSINNAESFENLADNAGRVGIDFGTLPLVVQFNKRDLGEILTEEEILKRWRATQWSVVFASALHGAGVSQSFRLVAGLLFDAMDKQYRLAAEHGLSRVVFLNGLLGGRTPQAAAEVAG